MGCPSVRTAIRLNKGTISFTVCDEFIDSPIKDECHLFVICLFNLSMLREMEGQPFALCPRNPKSLPFVEELVDQVLQLHPDISHIHIGADEVWNIGNLVYSGVCGITA